MVPNSKQSLSVMFCGDGGGKLLPPMVVYKSKQIYENWTKDSPVGKHVVCLGTEFYLKVFIGYQDMKKMLWEI